MGLDNPDRVLAETLRKNTYKNLPRKNNVIGSVKDIEKITKEDLYRCYSAFYQPSNMFIIATGNIDVKKAMEIIHHNFDGITSYPVPKKIDYKEDLTVAKAKEEIKMNVAASGFTSSAVTTTTTVSCRQETRPMWVGANGGWSLQVSTINPFPRSSSRPRPVCGCLTSSTTTSLSVLWASPGRASSLND